MITKDSLPTRTEMLDKAIRNIGRKNEARQLFLLWPSLKTASQRLAFFLSPYIVIGERSLLEGILDAAIASAVKKVHKEQVNAFVVEVAGAAEVLCRNQISIERDDGEWMVWDFERPIMDLLQDYGRDTVQIRPRSLEFPSGPVTMALLTRVFTVRDLMLADLEVDVHAS